MEQSRHLWRALEPVHAVVYYAAQVTTRLADLGYRVDTRWPGYFAVRAAPLGPAGPALVTALLYSFAPGTVAEHVPRAWRVADPAAVCRAREDGVLAALGDLLSEEVLDSAEMAEAADLAERAVGCPDVATRPLAAANLDAPPRGEPVLRLWRALTVLREHRGDGHVHALVAAGLDPVECLAQLASASDVEETAFAGRGWSGQEWTAALDRLGSRGLVRGRTATAAGLALREQVERRTDELAAAPWRHLGRPGSARLAGLLAPWARTVARSGVLPRGGTLALFRPPAGDTA